MCVYVRVFHVVWLPFSTALGLQRFGFDFTCGSKGELAPRAIGAIYVKKVLYFYLFILGHTSEHSEIITNNKISGPYEMVKLG